MIELVATLCVIAILTGIAVPLYHSETIKTRAVVCQDNQRMLKSQLNTFFFANNDVTWNGVKWNNKANPNVGNFEMLVVHNRDGSYSWYGAPDGFSAVFNAKDPPVCPVKGNGIKCVFTLSASGRLDTCKTECLTPKDDADIHGTNYNSTHSIDAAF